MKMQFKSKIVIVALSGAVGAFIIQSCSKIQASKPEPRTLAVPQLETGTGFGLSGETPSGLYRGGLLIWTKDVKPEQIRTLLNATRETNQKYVELNRYFKSFMEKEVKPMREQVSSAKSQYALAKTTSEIRQAPIQAEKAARWYEREADGIQSQFSSFDRAKMDGIFAAYCEAKILDLATRPFVAKNRFRSRPTPSALCESYYQDKFFTGASCADAPGGKNYYECLWSEGVLKTRFAQRMQIRIASRRAGTKTSDALSLADFHQLDLVKRSFALDDVPFCTSSDVRRAFLTGMRYRILPSGVILGGLVCGENARFEISFGPGEWDKDLSNASAAVLLDAVEVAQGKGALPVAFHWIDPAQATSQRDLAARVQDIAAKLSLFHASVTSCTGEFNSPNDVFFNDGRLSDDQALQGECKSTMPPAGALPDVVVLDPELESQRLRVLQLERDLAALKGNSCPVAPSCEIAPAGHARCDFLNAQVKKAAAAEVKGVASVLVTDFGLSFERVSPTASTVVLWMNGAAVGLGCVGENKTGSCTGAPVRVDLASAMPMQAEVSRDNELVIKMKIDVRQMASAGVPESVVKQFIQFNEAVLEANATSNSFDNRVPYLSGKAFIRSENAEAPALAEGSVSYLIENTFDKNLGDFCSAN